jgi:hypothetical protein
MPDPLRTLERAVAAGRGRDPRALADGSRVGVVGVGPAGSMFAYFLLRMAESVGLDLTVDIYEPRFFTHRGPAGCNHCGGIISESLVQMLAAEGINLPPSVVQQGIDATFPTPTPQRHHPSARRREADRRRLSRQWPRSRNRSPWRFDACSTWPAPWAPGSSGRWSARSSGPTACRASSPPTAPQPATTSSPWRPASTARPWACSRTPCRFTPAATQRTFICEFRLGEAAIAEWFGTAMHVFLLDLPKLGFAALIPKGEFVTLALLGEDLDDELVEKFLATPEVRQCFPGGEVPRPACHCYPKINVAAARKPFADRIVWVGDAGVARLYKDGIGSAYRTSKAAARAAVFHGVSARTSRALGPLAAPSTSTTPSPGSSSALPT